MNDVVFSSISQEGVHSFRCNGVNFYLKRRDGNADSYPAKGRGFEVYSSKEDALLFSAAELSTLQKHKVVGYMCREHEEGFLGLYTDDVPELKGKLCLVGAIKSPEDFRVSVIPWVTAEVCYIKSGKKPELTVDNYFVILSKYREEMAVEEERKVQEEANAPKKAVHKEPCASEVKAMDALLAEVAAKMDDWDNKPYNYFAKLKAGGRNAKVMPVDDFKKLVYDAVECPLSEDEDRVIYRILTEDDSKFSKAQADLKKVDFDLENVIFEKFNVTPSNIPYAFCYGGGDWEIPVYFALYFDGKSLRTYIPTAGNSYNSINKTAFGNDCSEDDARFVCKHLGIKYTLTTLHEKFLEEVDEMRVDDDYGLFYGKDASTSLMEQDIGSRLEPV